MTDLLSELNDQQQQVVRATDGPVLVLAGAGSGKTRALTYRIAYTLQSRKARPSEILAVTFTNKAAGEMKERVGQLVGGGGVVPRTICTFHSLGARILREQGKSIARSPSFIICDADDSERLVRAAMNELGISKKEYSSTKLKHQISQAKNRGQLPAEVAQNSNDGDVVAAVFVGYEKLLAKNDAYDFDDLIIRPIELLEQHIDLRERYQQRWRYLSVDEYQDTNPLQDKLLTLLTGPEKNICVVGDDYQAIYSWRGAKVDHILQFEKKFPSCQTIYLTRNYRSTPSIIRVANSVIAENKQQKHKKLWTNKSSGQEVRVVAVPSSNYEAKWVRREIEERVDRGYKRKGCVILYRTNAQSRVFEEEFLKHGIPYNIVGGFRFYERREIKDAIAFLQLWANNSSLLAVTRIAGAMWKGVGPKTLASWDNQVTTENNLLQVMSEQSRHQPVLGSFLNTWQTAADKQWSTVGELLSFLLKHSGYLKMLQSLPDGEERVENIEELVNVAMGFGKVEQFLEEVALLSDIDTLDKEYDRVTCMTLHAAKGLEYPVVFVVGCEEGLLPHANSVDSRAELEEERRLLYVGMTRAKEQLTITHARSRYQHGQYMMQSPSRFLKSLDNKVEWIDLGEVEGEVTDTQDIKKYLEMSGDSEPVNVAVEEGYFVSHKQFGRGVVIEVRGSVATCVFEKWGVKMIEASKLQSQ